MSLNPLRAELAQAKSNMWLGVGVSILPLATIAACPFLFKAGKLSHTNYRRLTGAAFVITLVAIGYGIKAVKQVGRVLKKGQAQDTFNMIASTGFQYLLQNPRLELFQKGQENTATVQQLLEHHGLITLNADPLSIAMALKNIIQEKRIVGEDLIPEQRRLVMSFVHSLIAKEINGNKPFTWASLVQAWPGTLPDEVARGKSPADAAKLATDKPWLCVGGLLDLAAGENAANRENFYNQVTASDEG